MTLLQNYAGGKRKLYKIKNTYRTRGQGETQHRKH